ncbi:membrane-spanning 4-domains subfamily A member 4A-like [Eucyclogobius newberryi]|uniref:membrane-spanning 4-domains subfamily A member 4A-like n=1 Tax=Eucyclogobius newberryi TaxID=166745 RepID=UPI003B5A5B12
MTEAAVVDAEPGLSDSPLVLVSFQKNAQRRLKFLEGEPKALGITQICLSVFQSSCMASFITGDNEEKTWLAGFFIISSVLIFIAGSVAIASKNLHLPTLKACVGMEIVASVASFFCLTLLMAMEWSDCFQAEYENSTYYEAAGHCRQIEASI